MRRRRRVATVAGTVVVAAAFAACAEPTDEPGVAGAERDRAGALALGDTHESQGLAITPVEVIEGAPEDLAGVDLEPAEQDTTPYYLHLRFDNTGHEAYQDMPHRRIVLVGSDGEQLTRLLLLAGELPPCEHTVPETPLEPGGTYETCLTFLAPPGVTPAAVDSDETVSWTIPPERIGQREDQPAGEPGGEPLPFGETYTFRDGTEGAGEIAGLSVTPVEVVQGAVDDLAAFDVGAEHRASTPYYVRLRFQDAERTARDIELSSVSFDVIVTDTSGEPMQPLTLLEPTGTFPRCETSSRMSDGHQRGDAYEVCEIFLGHPDAAPATVQFDPESFTPGPVISWAAP